MANPWDLHEMHGNVWEWVQDCRHPDYTGAPADGSALEHAGECVRRVVRGGGWDGGPADGRSPDRDWDAPVAASGGLGFRLARTL